MSTTTKPSSPIRRPRLSLRKVAVAAAAIASVTSIWVISDAPAQARRTSEPVGYSPEFIAAVTRYADAHRLAGLSPASMSPVGGCHGLSLASATGCSDDELRQAFCMGTNASNEACVDNQP